MSLLEHAKTEMRAVGLYDKDSDYGGMIPEAVEELVSVFAKQGHSGGSAGIVMNILEKVLRYKPLGPLTGKPDEWNNITDHGSSDGKPLYQNKRCSAVFAPDPNGKDAYYIDGKVFVDKYGGFTNWRSMVAIKFPYTPKTEYIKVGWPIRAWWNICDAPGRLFRYIKYKKWKKDQMSKHAEMQKTGYVNQGNNGG